MILLPYLPYIPHFFQNRWLVVALFLNKRKPFEIFRLFNQASAENHVYTDASQVSNTIHAPPPVAISCRASTKHYFPSLHYRFTCRRLICKKVYRNIYLAISERDNKSLLVQIPWGVSVADAVPLL